MNFARLLLSFATGSLRISLRGSRLYWTWVAVLLALIGVGAFAYAGQYRDGLVATNLRDPVSWGFYIANFTFFVGVAAAAVLVVIPAYAYGWRPIRNIVIQVQLMVLACLAMCMLFVLVDVGHPERALHMMPFIGALNLPSSLLAWDVLALNGYFIVSLAVAAYLLLTIYSNRRASRRAYGPFVVLLVVFAIGIQLIEAFIYNGIPGRPYWNTAMLAPKFLVGAFCSGPAVMMIVLQVLRKTCRFDVPDRAIRGLGAVMGWAVAVNLLLTGAEIFKEFYSHTEHVVHIEYLYFGLHGHTALVGWAWLSLGMSVGVLILLLIPRARQSIPLLNFAAVLVFISVFIEKGMGLLTPGYTPSVLGQIYEYMPSTTEWLVSAGIVGVGALLFTLMARVGAAVTSGELRAAPSSPAPAAPAAS